MNIYSAISANKWKTWIIMTLFVVFITTLAYVFCKALGFSVSLVGIAIVLSVVTSVGSFFYSDKMVLLTTGAKEIQKSNYPAYYKIVENLSIGDGLPMPKVYVVDDPSPNAFSTGRDPKHGVVVATTGLLNMMNESELEGVIAHELSHIKDYDIRLMGIVVILVGFVAILSDLFIRVTFFSNSDDDNKGNAIFLIIAIVLAILSPIVATLIQLAVSRKREFLADAAGVLLTRYPEGLASALEKLEKDKTAPKFASNATAHLYIENPFDNKKVKNLFTGLFNTHPPLEERIKILRSM